MVIWDQGQLVFLLNVIKHQRPGIDKIYLSAKDPFKSKYQLFINGRDKVGIKTLKNPKAFIAYSQTIDYVLENFEDYNRTKKRRVLIAFDDTIADMASNEILSPIVTELFLKEGNPIFPLFLYHNYISKYLWL